MSQIETQQDSIKRQCRPPLPVLSSPMTGSVPPSLSSLSAEPDQASEGENGKLSPAEQEIERKLLLLGIPPHVKGFWYIREAVKMLLEREDKIFGVTKILYPDIARLHDTTSTRVERAIRHAIELSWSRDELANCCIFAGRKTKPSNAEFLALLSRSISLNMLP